MREIRLVPSAEKAECAFDGLRASIRRVIEPEKLQHLMRFNPPATRTVPFSFYALPLPSFQSPVNIPQNIHISDSMPPTFHMNNFKLWAPPHRKPFSQYKSPNPCSPIIQNLPRPKPYNSLSGTLPLRKHHLPARPPAEVCVHISANSQPCTPPRQISIPQPNTYSENPKHGAASPHDLAPHISDPNPIPNRDPQDDTSIPIEPPTFRGDFAEDGLSSPSLSSSDDSLEEFFRPPDTQDDIPINPLILANHGPWEDSDLQESVPQADSLIDQGTTCPYPDPPTVLHSPPDRYQDSSEGASGEHGHTQSSDHPHNYNHQQLHPFQHNTDPDASYPNGARGNAHVGRQPKSSKRKTQ